MRASPRDCYREPVIEFAVVMAVIAAFIIVLVGGLEVIEHLKKRNELRVDPEQLLAARFARGEIDERDMAFLSSVASQVALHVQNVNLLAQRERQIRELDAIGRIGQLVSASYDLDEMLDVVYQTLAEVTQASVFFLLICEPSTQAVTNAEFV